MVDSIGRISGVLCTLYKEGGYCTTGHEIVHVIAVYGT